MRETGEPTRRPWDAGLPQARREVGGVCCPGAASTRGDPAPLAGSGGAGAPAGRPPPSGHSRTAFLPKPLAPSLPRVPSHPCRQPHPSEPREAVSQGCPGLQPSSRQEAGSTPRVPRPRLPVPPTRCSLPRPLACCLSLRCASISLPPNTNGLRSPWASTICCVLALGPAPNVEAENAVFRVFSQPLLQLEGSCEARALLTRPSEPSRGVRGRGGPGGSLRLTRQLQD